jgi:hypothetical protein
MLRIHGCKHQARNRMHQHRLAEGRTGARHSAPPHRRFHVHERQRHEFGEAAGVLLQRPDPQQDAAPNGAGDPHGRT